jgi:hypothetical protein
MRHIFNYAAGATPQDCSLNDPGPFQYYSAPPVPQMYQGQAPLQTIM